VVTLACGRAPENRATEQNSPEADGRPAPAEHAAVEGHAVAGGLPLLPIMQQLGANMAGLSSALWLEDYAGMAERAGAIAEHTGISPEELHRIQTELGPQMEEFEAADEAVHEASVRMRDAAEARQLDPFLDAYVEVQRGCVSCHTRFRDRLRTARP
jgi:hypothetical protein